VRTIQPPFHVAMVIPTGVGASQGGYGGDAMVWLNLIASVCDVCITHPNVANAAAFQQLPSNGLYVEGFALDAYFKGVLSLRPVFSNKVGIILDAGIEPGMKVLHHNVVNAVQATYGVDIVGVMETTEPLQLELNHEDSGASGGCWRNPNAALQPARYLMQTCGATAIAIVSRLEEPEDSTYAEGTGVDPIGGLEAVISHTLVKHLGIPCANAPCFDWEEAQPRRNEWVHPFTASEYTTASFLPCVLRGLHVAPQFDEINARGALHVQDLSALVLPYDAMGGAGVMAALHRGIPIIAVKGNQTVLPLTLEALVGTKQLERLKQQKMYIEVANYDEAAGVLLRLKLGLSSPNAAGTPRIEASLLMKP
jgi:hypothetical protein